MPKQNTNEAVEHLDLAVQAASNLQSPNVILPIHVAAALLRLVSPVPQDPSHKGEHK